MMDPASMLVGAGILLGGWLLGKLTPNRRQAPAQPGPICGCGHHRAYHDAANEVCHATVWHAGKWDRPGRDAQCTCKQYSGPVPIESYYAPELTSEDPS